jgi:hypothetical protein
MADTQSLAPTDAELMDLGHECELDAIAFGRAVLAKWGAQPVPAGYALVPVEPSAEMVDAAQEAYMPFGDMQLAIQLAIAAAPQPVAREPLIRQMLEALEQSQPFTEACANGKRMQWWGAQLDRAQDAINEARARLEEKP